jgi:Protein of unknown function DUF262
VDVGSGAAALGGEVLGDARGKWSDAHFDFEQRDHELLRSGVPSGSIMLNIEETMIALNQQDLGEDDEEEEFQFPPAERKVITQPLDLSVQTLHEQWTNKLLVLPEIQREYVWDNAKASRLIESLALNIPIPVLYFAETDDAKYEIFDGHQRVLSIVNYINGLFPLTGLAVLREFRGKRFSELPEREQRFLKMRTLRTILISIDSHPNMKFEIYERLNTGSISLNAQELRNSIYRGPFNDLLHDLAKFGPFRALVGSKQPRKRMVDEEAILRFFAMHEKIETYRTPLKKFLNTFMSEKRNATVVQIQEYRAVFVHAITAATALLGNSAFRMLGPDGQPTETAVNRALLETQLLASSWTVNLPLPNAAAVRTSVASLFMSQQFVDSVQRATGDRARTLTRARDTVAAFIQGGALVHVPHNLNA